MNLLTEDNLPYYFRTLSDFGRDGVWGEWTRRWTAEEGRHAIVIRDYLMVTRAVDPVSLERGRMQQVSTGRDAAAVRACATRSATRRCRSWRTRIAHRNTGKVLEDPAGQAIMARVSADENLHFLFYRDLASTAIEIDPSAMVVAMDRTVRGFTMPGTGIPDYARHARLIAAAGIYDYSIFLERVLRPVIDTSWQLESIEGLDADAEKPRVTGSSATSERAREGRGPPEPVAGRHRVVARGRTGQPFSGRTVSWLSIMSAMTDADELVGLVGHAAGDAAVDRARLRRLGRVLRRRTRPPRRGRWRTPRPRRAGSAGG